MKFRRATEDSLDLNLVPLIDCLLFLIVFFMLTTTFTKAGKLQVSLPEAKTVAGAQVPHSIEVSVNANGDYAVNGEVLTSKQATSLRSAIEKASEGSRDIPFVIAADGNTPHQAVVTVMDVAGQMGFQGLSISTRQPEGK